MAGIAFIFNEVSLKCGLTKQNKMAGIAFIFNEVSALKCVLITFIVRNVHFIFMIFVQ